MENFAFQNLVYFIAFGLSIFLTIINIARGSSLTDDLVAEKKQLLEEMGPHNSENFMKDFKLYHLRHSMTSGTKVPGILLLILNFAICYLAIFDGKIAHP